MGGFSLLGQLAGGYAQAAERERERQFSMEQQQRQNALGLTHILLESPNVPPEYKPLLAQYGMNVINSKGKLPDFHKEVVSQTPQIGTAAKTQQAQIPQLNLGMPAVPPTPQGIGTGQQQGAPSLTQSATAANGGAPPYIPPPVGQGGRAFSTGQGATPISAAGPGPVLPTVAPPPVPIQMTTGPNGEQIPVMTQQGGPTIPGRQQAVTQAQSANFTPAGQFRMMSPQEIMQRETDARLAQAQEISNRTGVPIERVLGLQEKYGTYSYGGGTYNKDTGEINNPAMPKPTGKVETLPDQSGQWHQYQILQDGTYKMIPTPEGVTIPPPPDWAKTLKSGVFHWVDGDGNVHETPYTTSSQKVLPKEAAGVGPAPPPLPGGGTAAPAAQPKAAGAGGGAGAAVQPKPAAAPAAGGRAAGRIISGNTPKLSPNLVRTDKSYKDISASLDKIQTPVDQLATRFSRLEETIKQGTPQADALVAPELLSVMAGGQGSGIRMSEAEIFRIVNGRSNWEKLKASINKWELDPDAARSITPAQQDQIQRLVAAVRVKIDQKRALFEQARTDLLNAKSPEEHRAIYNRVRNDALAIDTGTYQQPKPQQSQQTQGNLPPGWE